MEQGSTSESTSAKKGLRLTRKHKVFLSHSGAQKGFVEQLYEDLKRCGRAAFFDKDWDCLPIGSDFPRLIFEAVKECEVGVVVLSEEFFTSKWPMLELVAMSKVRNRKPSFMIMPVFFGLSHSQCRDVNNHKRWLSKWQVWAKEDKRIDLKDWLNALELFVPTNGLQCNSQLGEVKFRGKIVEAICRVVPSGTRFDDSHVQGRSRLWRSRLCKVVHDKIKQSKVSSDSGVHFIGIHGFGGIGKTTLCKAMCNDLSKEFRGKVAHMELGTKNEEELLKDVLRRLMDMNLERLGAKNVDEYYNCLKNDMSELKVFLAIDNVSKETRSQALQVFAGKYGRGSVVLVTARSLDILTSLQILGIEYMGMPELEMEEARSIFLWHARCVPSTYLSNKDDYELVSSCVQQCYFRKGDGNSGHYHPLALQTLGEELADRGYDRNVWRSILKEIDILYRESEHKVFSILRSSFYALQPIDQDVFMDAALFGPDTQFSSMMEYSFFEWLGVVLGESEASVMDRLKNLKRKSILEDLGDGFFEIGMHDLWREFARLEIKFKSGELEKRRWMLWNKSNTAEDCNMENIRRMYILDEGFSNLEGVRFLLFPKLAVLKLRRGSSSPRLQELDFTGLKKLKSLELDLSWCRYKKSDPLISIVGLKSLSGLGFLQLHKIPLHSACVDEISHLTNLRVLDLSCCGPAPDLSSLRELEVVHFTFTNSVKTVTGLGSKHTSLRVLDLRCCLWLESCPGVGELVALQKLYFRKCFVLRELPNLPTSLHFLKVTECWALESCVGVGELVALQELDLYHCSILREVPNLQKLKKLRKLNVGWCRLLKDVPGFSDLDSLEELVASPHLIPKLSGLNNFREEDCALRPARKFVRFG